MSSSVDAGSARLPAPTGPRPVGMTSLHLCDPSRPDPWAPAVRHRELMVSLWYPTTSTDGLRAPYLTASESEALLRDDGRTGVPPDLLSAVRTNAIADAPPTGAPGGLPLVVLSPGFTKPRGTLTSLAEDLASHGWVVAGVDHTYETVATAFPDGRVTTCLARDTRDRGHAFWRKLMTGRADDVSFVLDELTAPVPPWPGARLIDPARIAMAGHSAGGASTIPALLADPRIRAGADIDGSTQAVLPDSGLGKPFLFLGKQSSYRPGTGRGGARTWERDWPLLTGWKRWFLVRGAIHASFTDIVVLAEQRGIATGAELPAALGLEITRECVRAFLDLHLRGLPRPLLDEPSTHYPEIIRVNPGG